MAFKVNEFKTYKTKVDIRLGFVNPGGESPKIMANESIKFDGFTIKLADGREFPRAEGFQGMIEKGFAQEVQPKVKRIVHTKKVESPPVRNILFEAMDKALGGLSEEEDEDLEDSFEGESDLEDDFEEEDEEESWEDSGEDEDEEDWGEPSVDLGNGISLRNQSRDVGSSRDLGGQRSRGSLEDSARATVGSVTQAHDGGVYVGSGGGLPKEKRASWNQESIGFEDAQTIQTVARIPDIGVGNTQNAERIQVDQMSLNSISKMEDSMYSQRATPIGQGKKIASQLRQAELEKQTKIDQLIEKRAAVLAEIRKQIPKFKWDLRGDKTARFEKAMKFYEESNSSPKAKRNLEAVLKYELPDMKKRIQQEISYRQNPRPK